VGAADAEETRRKTKALNAKGAKGKTSFAKVVERFERELGYWHGGRSFDFASR